MAYTGIYVQRHADGTIYSVQVVDQFGHQIPLPPDDYSNREIQPPIETLPNKEDCQKPIH